VAASNHGVGHQNYLSYGGFPEGDGSFLYPEGAIIDGNLVASDRATIEAGLSEDITNSMYAEGTGGHPSGTEQVFDLHRGHSFVKAPRFNNEPMEVGPLARMMVAINRPSHPAHSHWATQYLIDLVTTYAVQPGTVARHGARCLETMILCDAMVRWLDELNEIFDREKGPGKTIKIHDGVTWDMEAGAAGWGMTEAPRGGLAHWVATDGDANIGHYACVVPTTWNSSPTDVNDKRGPYEEALMSLSGAATPLNICRVIRSFDPCIACAVHVIKPDGDVEKFVLDV
jgi:hydrogenase large subunit